MQYPWLNAPWLTFTNAYHQQKLAHAVLITGITGVGKTALAQHLAEFLLCKHPAEAACQQCKSCKLVKANTHPDLTTLSPEGTSQTIKIDDIRKLDPFITHCAQQGQHKVILIHGAHHLNTPASNALLKTLEEPAKDTYFILTCDHPEHLLPTIRSRCQITAIQPDQTIVLKWLKAVLNHAECCPKTLLSLANQSPLNAKKLALDNALALRDLLLDNWQRQTEPTQFADILDKHPIENTLNWLLSITADLIKIKLHVDKQTLSNMDQHHTLLTLANTQSTDFLYAYIDSCQALKRALQQKINLNTRLSLESLTIPLIKPQ